MCRNILITESQAEADEVVADPDGVFAHYFRYLRGVGKVTSFDQNLDNPSSVYDVPCTVQSSDGTRDASARLSYARPYTSSGGDFGIVTRRDFDHHAKSYWMLNMSCVAQYVYPVSYTHLRAHET